jgi:hypothetical protein
VSATHSTTAATTSSDGARAPRGRRREQQVHIGAVWVSLMEPDVGSEAAFDEWYGDDHFYAGGMGLPWIFAGRRWVCPRTHQAVRISQSDSTFQPPQAGRFLHLNFFSRGHVDEAAVVLGDTIARLAGEGRMYVDDVPRRHVFSRLQPYAGVVYADPDAHGPLDVHALDHPFGGVAVEVVRTVPGRSREDLVGWLLEEFVPAQLATTGAALCLVALDAELPDAVAQRTSRVPRSYGADADQRVTLLWFAEEDLLAGWADRFAPHLDGIGDGGLGVLEFASPFVPTVPGTNRHIDAL